MDGTNSIQGGGQESQDMIGTFNVRVTHRLNQHEIAVSPNSSFGDLKSVIVQKISLKPEMHKLFLRGKEKNDDADLQTAGVKDGSKVLLVEDTTCTQRSLEFQENPVISRGVAAVAEVTEEVDKLSAKVSALQATLNKGTKVENKDIIYVTEMLMRQLLKLDGIEAEGEGKMQRKMEVRRIQSLVETVDFLKAKNLNPFNNVDNSVSVATHWETFEPDWDSTDTTSPVISFPANPQQSPTPDPNFTPMPSISTSTSTAIPLSVPNLAPCTVPIQISTPTTNPHQLSTPFMASPMPSSAFSLPSVNKLSPIPTKMQVFAPMPSSTKVTEDWVRFD